MATKTIPFDLETAKKILSSEIKGVVKYDADKVNRILATDLAGVKYPPIAATYINNGEEIVFTCYEENLQIEVDEPEFKPFDKVLVRHYDVSLWQPAFFWKFFDDLSKTPYYTIDGKTWEQCISYNGNEYLLGTTDKPQ